MPAVLPEMLADKDTKKADRAMNPMMQMDKIDIEPLQRALARKLPVVHSLPTRRTIAEG